MVFELHYFIAWFLFWTLGWLGIYYFLPKERTNYERNYIFVSIYFLVISIIMILYFKDIIFEVYKYLNFFSVILIVLLLIFNFLSYRFANKYLIKPAEKLLKYADNYYLHLDKRYIISKSFDILFQQILIIALVFLLRNNGLNLLWISILFAIMFGIGHIPALKVDRSLFGLVIFVASLLSSFLFPYLIITFKYGFVYTYMAHWLFYTNTGVLFWIIENFKSKMK